MGKAFRSFPLTLPSNSNIKEMTNKTFIIIAILSFVSTTAMAQTSTIFQWVYTERYPKFPPLRVDFHIPMLIQAQQPLLLMMSEGKLKEDTIAGQSIMLRHMGNKTTTQFYFKHSPNYQPTGDGLKGFRDYIVRKRRWKEGRPLQPLPPMMRRW